MVDSAPNERSETTGPVSPKVTRIDYIDGLRGLAVLIVLVSHVALHARTMNGALTHVLLEGSHGVDLFFVLSGFCLAYPALKAWRMRDVATFDLASFASKRLVRILPPFYLATFVLLTVAVVARLAGHQTAMQIPSALNIAQSLLFLDLHNQLLNGSFWTLMVEFRWYFLFPVALLIWFRSPRAFFAVMVACVVLYNLTRARGLDVGTLPGFMLGIVAADIHLGSHLRPDLARAATRFALPLALVCAGIGIAGESSAWIPGFNGADVAWKYQPTIVGWQLATFLFVVAAGALPGLRRLFEGRALVATGIASYAIYLVHEPIIATVEGKYAGSLGLVAAGIVSLAAGFGFWALAERPFTTGRWRSPLLAFVNPLVRRGFALIGVTGTMQLAPAPAHAAPAVAVPATPHLATSLS